MEDEDFAPNTYLQLIQSVWAESRASTLYSSILYVHARLSAHTYWISCMYIWRNILVFYFASYSIKHQQLIILGVGVSSCGYGTSGGFTPTAREQKTTLTHHFNSKLRMLTGGLIEWI